MTLFFKSPIEMRKWLKSNHSSRSEQWIGFYKKGTKIPSITWPESVDEALCFGWIDGLRKSIDEKRYKIRFTPRRQKSHWSKVNLERVKSMSKEGRMQKPGLAIHASREKERSAQAAYERSDVQLDPSFESRFKKSKKAWSDFTNRTPSYRKKCTWWIMSAKKPETRTRRLDVLIESSKAGNSVPQLRWTQKTK